MIQALSKAARECIYTIRLTRSSGGRTCAYYYHGVVVSRSDGRLERNLHLVREFREQITWLHARAPVVSMSYFAGGLGQADHGTQLITFDDGYANNLLAAEIMAEIGVPWTVFVSTGAVGKQGAIWTVELSLLLLHGELRKMEALEQSWSLETRESREATFQTIRNRMKTMPAVQRRATMGCIRRQFPGSETARLLEKFPAFQMMDWNEIRQLSASGVEIGSHGVEHEIHHATQDPEVRRSELLESKLEIERKLGKPCRYFAFPNGNHCEPSVQEVQAAGYELAFTTQEACVRPNSNRFLLPRVSPRGSLAGLKKQLAGLS